MESAVNTTDTKVAQSSIDDLVTRLVNDFETSEELSVKARALGERCRDYVDNKQYTDSEAATLKKRKQPPLTWNRVKRKVNFLTGYEVQQRMDPKAYPRNPQDEEGAHAATDAIRFVHDKESLAEKHSDAFDNGIVEGFGALEVMWNEGKSCPSINSVPWSRVYYDPFSQRHDFSDATYKGIVVWMDEAKAKRAYPDNHDAIDGTFSREFDSVTSETYEDRPAHRRWISTGQRKRLRVCQVYYLDDEGQWNWAHFTKGGLLKGGAVVPFLDEDGVPECPLILWSCYVDRDNNRYGEVVELLDIQDEINKRRSKLLYRLSVRQVKMDKGAVDSVEAVRNELARPDGVVQVNPSRNFEILENSDLAAGELQLLQEAKSEMEFAGPNASLMGDTKGGQSGRAIIASQQGGLSELGRVLSRYRNFKLRTYRQIWNRIRQFWQEEKWIRVTDDERNIRFVGLNRPETVGDYFISQMKSSGAPPEEIKQAEMQIKSDPRYQAPTGRKLNNVAEMDVDIVIDEAHDTVVLQQEQFAEIADLVKAGVPIPPDALIEASSLKNKDKILERMKEMQAPQVPPEVQEAQARTMVAGVTKAEADASKAQADANKAHLEVQSGTFEYGFRTGTAGEPDPEKNTAR